MAENHAVPLNEWLIIVNPNAGIKKGFRDWTHISRLLKSDGISHLCVLTEYRNHACELTDKLIREGYRKIAVVGGDGTMNEVVNGIFQQNQVPSSDITLGMIPVGTGNDWCRSFGIPFDYKEAVKILANENTFLQDTGKISYFRGDEPMNRYFINIAGMGYDALVANKTNLSKEKGKGGPMTYLFYVFTSLFQYRFIDAVIEVEGKQVFRGEIFSMNVGICRYSGGGMLQVPAAVPDDGLFDITLIKKAPKWLVIRYAHKLYDGSLVHLPFINTYRGDSVRVRSAGKIFLEADGESLGHSPFVYEILPKSLRVVVGHEMK